MRAKATTRVLLVSLAGLGAAALVAVWIGRPMAIAHVQRVTGSSTVTRLGCLDCHGRDEQATVTAEGAVHADPYIVVPSRSGDRLFVACTGSASVVTIDIADHVVVQQTVLTGRPRGLALSPDGARLAVSLHDRDEVVVLDAITLQVEDRIEVGEGPAGLAYGRGGALLIVANSLSGDLSVVDPATGRELRRLAAGREPYAAAASPDGRTVAVVSRMATVTAADSEAAAELTLVDAETGTVRLRIPLDSCHLSESLTFTPAGDHLLIPAIRTRNLLPILQVARGWVMSSVLVVLGVAAGDLSILPLGDVNRAFPDPMGISVSADGRRVFVASGGSDQVAVLDLPRLLRAATGAGAHEPELLSLSRGYVERTFEVGCNPTGLTSVGGAAGPALVVAERLDDRVAFFDAGGRVLARVPVWPEIPEDLPRAGARVFNDATYAFQHAFSCRSCHPDGHTDGLTYDFDIDGVGRNPVLNRSLQGVAGTAPFKWIGLNKTLNDQCGPRFAMVLTRADPFPSERLEELVAYIQSLPAPRGLSQAGWIGGRDTGSAGRGRLIFERSHRKDGTEIPPAQRCSTCHSGPKLTNRRKADVGTRSVRDDRSEFDVPHLTGIGQKAPYMHDGRAATLEEIWTTPGVDDLHGAVTDLNKADLNDLVNYLRSL